MGCHLVTADVSRALLAIVGLALAGGGAAAPAWSDSDADSYGRPEMGRSVDPDGLDAESEDPDDRVGESRDPDDMTAGSEDPDGLMVESGDPDSMTTDSEDPDDHRGRHSDLGDLRESDGGEGRAAPAPELVARAAPPGPGASAAVMAAWRRVGSAERNLEAMNDVYQKMMHTDYPRGERRARIIAERNEALEAVNRARTRYAQLSDS
ncbi:MAG: hypothetical protein ACQGVK_07985 [Myxococcota bacterium]